MSHLLELGRRASKLQVPSWLRVVSSPLVIEEWARDLSNHPDQRLKNYIISGISRGFRIGFNHGKARCKSAISNLHSAAENAGVVQVYLDNEVALGRIVGPVEPHYIPTGTQLSPFGVIPKSNQPGKWRLIVDLSSPESASVNSGIEPELCSMQYL